MRMGRIFGLMVAGLVAAWVIAGGATLIALDFMGPERLSEALTELGTVIRNAATFRFGALTTGCLDQYARVDVPGDATLKVLTGTTYASAQDVVDRRASSRWCFAMREATGTGYAPMVVLGHQRNGDASVFIARDGVNETQAAQLGLSVDGVLDLSHRFCRFVG